MLYFSAPKFAFAFNPIVIEAASDAPTISFTANGHTITRPSRGKETPTPFYVQSIAQSLFDPSVFHSSGANLGLLKNMKFTVSDGAEIQNGNFDVIWGALQFGETYTQDKTLTWFRGMPFHVPLYLSSAKTIRYRIDRGEILTAPAYVGSSPGRHNLFMISTYFPGIEDARDTLQIIVEGDSGGDPGIFDYTFDYTFRPVARDSIFMNVNIRDCTNGVYLRWINKHGEYCYYLFSDGTSSRAVQNGDVNLNEFVRTLDSGIGYNHGSNRYSEKNVQGSVRLFAPLVDETTFDMLNGLPEALIVDLYAGKNEYDVDRWVGVNISPGTFSRTKSVLQDFECTMLYPKTFNQSL